MNLKEKIAYLESLGVTFQAMNKGETKHQLKINYNFFELLTYLDNYEKTSIGTYLNCDIAYLIDLYRIDITLRKVIIDLCLNLEYQLKKCLSYYFDLHPNDYKQCLENAGKDVANQIRKTMNYLDEKEAHTTINVILNMHFFPLIHLYRWYGECIFDPEVENHFYCLLKCKDLRNDCAHNQPLLHCLRPSNELLKQSHEVLQAVSQVITSKQLRKKRLNNPTLLAFACLLYIYPILIEHEQFLQEAKSKLYEIKVMMRDHLNNYQDTALVTSSLQFMVKLIDNFNDFGRI